MSSSFNEPYNALPLVDHAYDSILRNYEAFLEVLGKLQHVFSKREYMDYGVWVAHRHFELGDKEMMVTRMTGEKQWTMAPEPKVVAKAIRWICKPNSTESLPLEFIVINSQIEIPEPPAELWKAFMDAIAGHDCFSIGICWLAFGEPLTGTQIYFETTDDTGGCHKFKLRGEPCTSKPPTFTTAYRAYPSSALALRQAIDESDNPSKRENLAMEIHTQCLHIG